MGTTHSTYSGQAGLDVPDREGVGDSPDVSMIEPVPEGLEHVVYPKYEEAFRLGLEAFSNTVRVNKFYRPLPHILGSSEFQKHSHAGIIPVAKPNGGSQMPAPHSTTFTRHRRSVDMQELERRQGRMVSSQGECETKRRRTRSSEENSDWDRVKQSVTLQFSAEHHSYADFGAVEETLSNKSSSKGSVASDADAAGYVSTTTLNPASSVQALAGGLFDSDEAMSNALADYRQVQKTAPKEKKSSDRGSASRSHLTRRSVERSQAMRDLELFGKSLNDLKQQRAAEGK